MRAAPDDDLFRDSTMTFGEHLEELRGALFRSVIGIFLGFLMGLLLAKTVVRWIEVPLQNGLRNHYLALSRNELASGAHDSADLDQWVMLTEDQLLPQQVTVDANSLLRELHRLLPEQFPSPPPDEVPFPPGSLPAADAPAMLRDWQQAGRSRRNTFARKLWQQLPTAAQSNLAALAERPGRPSEIQSELLQQLNWLAARLDPELSRDQLNELFSNTEQRKFVHNQLDQRAAAPANRAAPPVLLNRQLIAATFADTIRLPKPATFELTTWQPIDVDVQALSVHEPFVIFVKAALVVGLVLSSPWVFFQIWQFVAVGLYPHERHLVYKFMPISLGLFLAGACLAFFFVFEPVLDFLFGFNRILNIHAQPRITDWMSFVLILPLGFGLSFQLPLVMVLLERIGVFTVDNYLSHWRIAVLVIFILAMLLTPADPVSMLLMAIPLTGLYFGGIALCTRLKQPQRSPVGAGYDP